MKGMRKRVAIGFLGVVGLLFFSGMLSFVELGRLGRGTGDILQASRRNIELAKQMLDAAHDLNVALIRRTVFGEKEYDSLCYASLTRLEDVLSIAQAEAYDESFLDSLAFTTIELKVLVDTYLTATERAEDPFFALAGQAVAESLAAAAAASADTTAAAQPLFADSLAADASVFGLDSLPTMPVMTPMAVDKWYTEEFEGVYDRLSSAVKAYMTSTQSSLAPRTEQMKRNAYRAVTPVLISLAVMIAIVLMLYYFMSIYCVNPIIDMNRSLGRYLTDRTPLEVPSECKDEVLELREKIEMLISRDRQRK